MPSDELTQSLHFAHGYPFCSLMSLTVRKQNHGAICLVTFDVSAIPLESAMKSIVQSFTYRPFTDGDVGDRMPHCSRR